MKALVWEAPSTMHIREHAAPDVSDDEVLIRVERVGICGSELSGYLGHNALRVPPLIMGHEFAGEIVSVGAEAVDVNPELAEGRLVTVNPLDFCGECLYCQQGLNQLCVNRRLLGAHRPGAFAELISVPARLVRLLPNGMSTRIGALTEPVGCAVRIGELAGNVAGESCLVIGAGPIGLLSAQMMLLNGARQIFISEVDPERLAMGDAIGCETINPQEQDPVQVVRDATNGLGVAVSVDAVGSATTRDQCVKATRATGTMILSGLHEESSEFPAADTIRREITVKGSFAYSPDNFAAALTLLSQDKIHLDPWITEAPLKDGGKWFDQLISAPGNVSKVLLVP